MMMMMMMVEVSSALRSTVFKNVCSGWAAHKWAFISVTRYHSGQMKWGLMRWDEWYMNAPSRPRVLPDREARVVGRRRRCHDDRDGEHQSDGTGWADVPGARHAGADCHVVQGRWRHHHGDVERHLPSSRRTTVPQRPAHVDSDVTPPASRYDITCIGRSCCRQVRWWNAILIITISTL